MEFASDAPLFVVLNSVSGHEDADACAANIAAVLGVAGRRHEILRVDDARRLGECAARAVESAAAGAGAVVAAGGDGTLNAVARAALGRRVPYGVIPQGTFNYFARSHGIPTETEAATRALLDARPTPVPVGLVNDRLFLVNASLGLYPELLEAREAEKRRHGRTRWIAAWAAVRTLPGAHRPLRIRLERAAGAVELRTLTLFVGANRLQLEQMGWEQGGAEHGRLVAIVLRPVSTGRLLWLMVRGALGQLPEAHGVDSFEFSSLHVQLTGRVAGTRVKVATDGEVALLETPLEFRLAAEPLWLLTPRDATPETAT